MDVSGGGVVNGLLFSQTGDQMADVAVWIFGTQFDPHLVEIMLSLIEEGVIDAERLYAKAKGEQKE